jgi:glycopeptide antibiotics resistance protein
MRKLIEFTKNWKRRDLLHIMGGFLIGASLTIIIKYFAILAVFSFANYWEYTQVKCYKAKYSISDILLTTLGGILGFVLVNFFN